jgi:hypothetical protein
MTRTSVKLASNRKNNKLENELNLLMLMSYYGVRNNLLV